MPSHSRKKHLRGASPAQRRWQHVREQGYLSESLVKMRRAIEAYELKHPRTVVREEERPVRSRSYGSDGGFTTSWTSSARFQREETFCGYTEAEVKDGFNSRVRRSPECSYPETRCVNRIGCSMYSDDFCNGRGGLLSWMKPGSIKTLALHDYLDFSKYKHP